MYFETATSVGVCGEVFACCTRARISARDSFSSAIRSGEGFETEEAIASRRVRVWKDDLIDVLVHVLGWWLRAWSVAARNAVEDRGSPCLIHTSHSHSKNPIYTRESVWIYCNTIQLVPLPAAISAALSEWPSAGGQILTGTKWSSVVPTPKLPCSFQPHAHTSVRVRDSSSPSDIENKHKTCSLPQTNFTSLRLAWVKGNATASG